MRRVTQMTHFPQEFHTRGRGRAHSEVTAKSVTMCHLSPGADPAPYATGEADEPHKPVYRVGDDVLAFKRGVRLAAIDVMILTFAAVRHAQWLGKLGLCPPDIAQQIERHLAGIAHVIRLPPKPRNP